MFTQKYALGSSQVRVCVERAMAYPLYRIRDSESVQRHEVEGCRRYVPKDTGVWSKTVELRDVPSPPVTTDDSIGCQ